MDVSHQEHSPMKDNTTALSPKQHLHNQQQQSPHHSSHHPNQLPSIHSLQNPEDHYHSSPQTFSSDHEHNERIISTRDSSNIASTGASVSSNRMVSNIVTNGSYSSPSVSTPTPTGMSPPHHNHHLQNNNNNNNNNEKSNSNCSNNGHHNSEQQQFKQRAPDVDSKSDTERKHKKERNGERDGRERERVTSPSSTPQSKQSKKSDGVTSPNQEKKTTSTPTTTTTITNVNSNSINNNNNNSNNGIIIDEDKETLVLKVQSLEKEIIKKNMLLTKYRKTLLKIFEDRDSDSESDSRSYSRSPSRSRSRSRSSSASRGGAGGFTDSDSEHEKNRSKKGSVGGESSANTPQATSGGQHDKGLFPLPVQGSSGATKIKSTGDDSNLSGSKRKNPDDKDKGPKGGEKKQKPPQGGGSRKNALWSAEDDETFAKAYLKHGKSWKTIHSYLPDKTREQVQSHGQYLIRIGKLQDLHKDGRRTRHQRTPGQSGQSSGYHHHHQSSSGMPYGAGGGSGSGGHVQQFSPNRDRMGEPHLNMMNNGNGGYSDMYGNSDQHYNVYDDKGDYDSPDSSPRSMEDRNYDDEDEVRIM